MTRTQKYLENYLNEKDIPFQIFEIQKDNTSHFISTDVIKECILSTGVCEQTAIANSLKKIDYYNSSVIDYFKFLAKVLVKKND